MLVSHAKFTLPERNCHTQFFNFSHGEMPSSAQAKFVSSHYEIADWNTRVLWVSSSQLNVERFIWSGFKQVGVNSGKKIWTEALNMVFKEKQNKKKNLYWTISVPKTFVESICHETVTNSLLWAFRKIHFVCEWISQSAFAPSAVWRETIEIQRWKESLEKN